MSEILYSCRWSGPSFIEQGKDQTVSVAVERNGAAAAVASGTLSLYRADGTLLVDSVAGSAVGGVFTSATIAAASTASETLGQGWLVRLDLVIDGSTITFYNDAVLCLARLYPPIGQTDMVARHSEAVSLNAGSSLQDYIDQGWRELTVRLYTRGVPYWKWRTPSALSEVMLAKALSLMFLDYATLMNNNDRYLKLADAYRAEYERGVEGLQSKIDESEDNTVEAEAASAAPVILLSSGPSRRFRR